MSHAEEARPGPVLTGLLLIICLLAVLLLGSVLIGFWYCLLWVVTAGGAIFP